MLFAPRCRPWPRQVYMDCAQHICTSAPCGRCGRLWPSCHGLQIHLPPTLRGRLLTCLGLSGPVSTQIARGSRHLTFTTHAVLVGRSSLTLSWVAARKSIPDWLEFLWLLSGWQSAGERVGRTLWFWLGLLESGHGFLPSSAFLVSVFRRPTCWSPCSKEWRGSCVACVRTHNYRLKNLGVAAWSLLGAGHELEAFSE